MPHRHNSVPGYREHRPSGQAVVTLDGRDFYLGPFGTPESHAKYQRLIREYVNGGFRMPRPADPQVLRVGHLCERYKEFAEREYKHVDGTPTGTVNNTQLAMQELFEFACDLSAAEFGPRLLTQFREKMIARGLARATINDRIGIVRRAFKWAAGQELLPAAVYHALMTVPGLRRGRGGARETDLRGKGLASQAPLSVGSWHGKRAHFANRQALLELLWGARLAALERLRRLPEPDRYGRWERAVPLEPRIGQPRFELLSARLQAVTDAVMAEKRTAKQLGADLHIGPNAARKALAELKHMRIVKRAGRDGYVIDQVPFRSAPPPTGQSA